MTRQCSQNHSLATAAVFDFGQLPVQLRIRDKRGGVVRETPVGLLWPRQALLKRNDLSWAARRMLQSISI
jgi:hypothetical protein